jgi:predicted ABC-type transport system involved in lysophospholipase L1 biosynthesis ATPase subunit
VTFLLVTHNQAIARETQRVVRLSQGMIVQECVS